MGGQEYKNKIFKIDEVGEPLGLAGLLRSHRLIVTYNQLMKSDCAPQCLFIFDEKGPEVPSLIMYCHHFGVQLLKISQEEARETQSVVKHARLVGIPKNIEIPEGLSSRLASVSRKDVQVDVLRIRNLRI